MKQVQPNDIKYILDKVKPHISMERTISERAFDKLFSGLAKSQQYKIVLAAEKFIASKEAKFATYAIRWFDQQIIRGIIEMD